MAANFLRALAGGQGKRRFKRIDALMADLMLQEIEIEGKKSPTFAPFGSRHGVWGFKGMQGAPFHQKLKLAE